MSAVSVVIPAYNDGDVLPRAIDSVLSQTLEDVEVIVVDDGSDDDTAAVVGRYDDSRLEYLVHETNRGASAARNTGLELADRRYVAFLDADDEWLPEKLERQVALLESRSPEWVAAYCGVELAFSGRGAAAKVRLVDVVTRRGRTEGQEGGEELIRDVLTDDLHTSAGSTLLVRRDVAEAVDGFDESFDRFQDPEFLIRVLRQGKLAYVDAPLVRRHVSDDPPPDVVRAADEHYLETFSETVARLERRGYDVVGAHHYMLAKGYLRHGELRTGLRYLATARRPTLRQCPGLLGTLASGIRRSVRG